MNAQDSNHIVDTYTALINKFTLENACAFLQSVWLIDSNDYFTGYNFEKLIYTLGNRNEIYTGIERSFISRIKENLYLTSFKKKFGKGFVDCKIVVIELENLEDSLYESIATMKVFNKAFDSYNIFLFVCENGLHFGSSSVNDDKMDCYISPLITPNINWEYLFDYFLFRNNSEDFYDYYLGILGLINVIPECYKKEPIENNEFFINSDSNYDNDMLEEPEEIDIENYCDKSFENESDFDPEDFFENLNRCFKELNFVKSTEVNPLDLLMEAEKAYNNSSTYNKNINDNKSINEKNGDEVKFNLLDDPIELMKKLKNERGL